MNRRPHDEPFDLDRTDTLPVLVLDVDDTGTLAVPHLPQLEIPRRPHVEDELFSATDSFTAATLAVPIAAIPVGIPDLAESLRERELCLLEAGRRVQELDAQLVQADEHCAELETKLAQSDARCARLEVRLAQADERGAGLQSQLEQMSHRCEELEQQCVVLREAGSPGGAPPVMETAAQGLFDEVAALRRTNGLLHESISSLHGRLGMHEAMLAEAEQALHSAGAAAQGVDWPARYSELELMLESERAAAAGKLAEQADRLAALAVQARVTAPAPTTSSPAPGREIDVPARVLILLENGTESVHPLGRRTSIGRTPDNDIQIDVSYVSRHHAVLLSSAGECILEDLNSTNGLLVNGHRAGRQILQHGDMLTVGKTRFRYEIRA